MRADVRACVCAGPEGARILVYHPPTWRSIFSARLEATKPHRYFCFHCQQSCGYRYEGLSSLLSELSQELNCILGISGQTLNY